MMIKLFKNEQQISYTELQKQNTQAVKNALWIDVLMPSEKEIRCIEEALGIDLPTQKEMQSLEHSSRLFKKSNHLFMTMMMVCKSARTRMSLQPVTFIMAPRQLITLRYSEPSAFSQFVTNITNYDITHDHPVTLLLALLDTALDRMAAHLNFLGEELDNTSDKLFEVEHLFRKNTPTYYKKIIRTIGLHSDFNDKLRESLVTEERLLSFLSQSLNDDEIKIKNKIKTLNMDASSLSDYTTFISSKTNFLLDTTLGLINIDQSIIIKIFTVAAVIFLPPTLIASVYGMNFKFMPELSWTWGYLFALLLMISSAICSYKFFKYKKWL